MKEKISRVVVVWRKCLVVVRGQRRLGETGWGPYRKAKAKLQVKHLQKQCMYTGFIIARMYLTRRSVSVYGPR